jgi:hypothetical protein
MFSEKLAEITLAIPCHKYTVFPELINLVYIKEEYRMKL